MACHSVGFELYPIIPSFCPNANSPAMETKWTIIKMKWTIPLSDRNRKHTF